jgi:hypothetical protein
MMHAFLFVLGALGYVAVCFYPGVRVGMWIERRRHRAAIDLAYGGHLVDEAGSSDARFTPSEGSQA